MNDRPGFRWATTSARLLAGTLAATGFVVAVVTALSLAWPTLERTPVQVAATPAPADTVLVCDGGLLAIGREAVDASRILTAAPQSIVTGVDRGDADPLTVPLTGPTIDGTSPPVAVIAEPADGARTDVAASGSVTVSADDLRGFSATACRPALMESWLVGGSASTGASDVVLLANPGTVPATVQLSVYGATGRQNPPGGTDLVIAPGAQIVVPLAGLVLGEESPVLRVTATGAPVQASLQTSITRTLVPGGVDQVGAIAASAPSQTIPGVSVTQSPGADGATGTATLVRILSADADTEVTITATPIGAAVSSPTSVTVPVTAGIPTEVELPSLAIGTYTIDVAAGAPVVAAVWETTGFDEGSDFAWYVAAPEVSAPSLFATPAGPEPLLALANPSDTPVTVTVQGLDGALAEQVTVAPGSSQSLPLSTRSVYRIGAEGGGIRAGITQAGDGALAGFPVWPSDAAAGQIAVYP